LFLPLFAGFPLYFAYVMAVLLARVYEPLSDVWNLLRVVFYVVIAWLLSLLTAFVAGSFLAGIFWPLLRPLYKARCARNGAPFLVGDYVRILAGRHKDRVVRVYSAWEHDSVRVELGEREREKLQDIFSSIELLRENVEPDAATKSRQPSSLSQSPDLGAT
jgi:hypothetical protein